MLLPLIRDLVSGGTQTSVCQFIYVSCRYTFCIYLYVLAGFGSLPVPFGIFSGVRWVAHSFVRLVRRCLFPSAGPLENGGKDLKNGTTLFWLEWNLISGTFGAPVVTFGFFTGCFQIRRGFGLLAAPVEMVRCSPERAQTGRNALCRILHIYEALRLESVFIWFYSQLDFRGFAKTCHMSHAVDWENELKVEFYYVQRGLRN